MDRPRPTMADYPQIVEEIDEEAAAWKEALTTFKPQLTSDNDEHWDMDDSDPKDQRTKNEFFQGVVEGYEGKRIFVCCDGTGQNASGTTDPMTNVAKLARAVDRIGRDTVNPPDANLRQGFVRQIVYYSAGVGTQSSILPDRQVAYTTGKGLTKSMLSAYCFICNNYNMASCADEIILVGFSRGAFTVRCLAHFISEVGLLRRKGLQFLRTVFTTWRRWGNAKSGSKEKDARRHQLDKELDALEHLLIPNVRIKVLAEWDTVSSLGSLFGIRKKQYSFVNETVPANVENAFLALAIDEKRYKFEPRQWRVRNTANNPQFVKQCAFVGCHSDIGGGVPDMGLSSLSLLWMVAQIEDVCKAKFDRSVLLQFMTTTRQPRTAWWRRLVNLGRNKTDTPPDREGQDTDADTLISEDGGENDGVGGGNEGAGGAKGKIQLKNFDTSKGVIHESFTFRWKLLRVLTFGICHGRRENLLYSANSEDPLEVPLYVHWTAGLLSDKLNSQLFKTHEHDAAKQQWTKKGNPEDCLPEDKVNLREKKSYWAWKSGVDRLRETDELDDGDVNWTEMVRRMGWDAPSRDVPNDAIIELISNSPRSRKDDEEEEDEEEQQ